MRLEGLRGTADTLGDYSTQRSAPPIRRVVGSLRRAAPRSRWSSRSTNPAFPPLLRVALDSVVSDLRGLPVTPNQESDYQGTYDLLRAYLISTRNPDRTDPALLSQVLGDHWNSGGGTADDSLSRLQFEFFGKHLVSSPEFDNPAADEAVIVKTRDFLSRMGAVRPFYVSLINKANLRTDGFSIDDESFGPGALALTTRTRVPGAFSLVGREYVKEQLSQPDSLLQAEEWVLGPISLPDPQLVAQGIDSLYETEYRNQWKAILGQAYVPPFQGAGDAARKLGDLAGDNSPLTHLLSVASNTVFVGELAEANEFLPLNAFLPRDSTGRMGLSGSAMAYFDALDQLKSAMEDMERTQGTETLARAEEIGLMQIPQAEGAVRLIRREMGTDPAGREVANHLVALLS